MKTLKFITMWRFSHLDVIWLLLSFHFFTNGRWLEGLLAFFVGILTSVWIERWIRRKEKPAWQMAADNGYPVTAIKMHMQQHGSTLREAKDAVDRYLNIN